MVFAVLAVPGAFVVFPAGASVAEEILPVGAHDFIAAAGPPDTAFAAGENSADAQ